MHGRAELNRATKVLAEGAPAEARPDPATRDLAARYHQRARRWLDQPEVVGFGVGKKRTDGEVRKRLALVVAVVRKRPRSACDEPVPKTLSIPGVRGRVPTDVVEVGRLRPQHDPRLRQRPARGGASLGHPDVPYGTLGGLVTHRDQDGVFVLSAAHVLANYGLALPNDPIWQPGRDDPAGAGDRRIGALHSWVPYVFSQEGYPNRVDAAIARVAKAAVHPEIVHIGLPAGVSSYIREGMIVRKTGRSTDYRAGEVINPDFQLSLDYPHPAGGRRRVGFGNQVLCTPFTQSGDSGALIFNHEDKIIGLHLAGSPKASVFSRIGFALEALKIDPILTPRVQRPPPPAA